MKENETDYLNKLFASSSDITDEAEVEIPLVDVPEGLSDKLYGIAETTSVQVANTKGSKVFAWPKVTSIAAGLLVAVMALQFYQQQQTLKRLEQAQTDLATALHYLGEANRITRAQVQNSLQENLKKAGVEPVFEIETEYPAERSHKPETKPRSRSL